MAIKVTRPQIDLREEINKALTLRGLENQLITVNGLVSNGKVQIGTNPRGYTGGHLFVHNDTGDDATTKAELSDNSVLLLQPGRTNSTHMSFGQVNGGNGIGIQVTNASRTADWDIALNPFGGNVGIGTIAPDYPLHIYGTGHKRLKIEKTDAGGDADIQLSSKNDSTQWILFHDRDSGNNSGVIKYVHSTNKMHFRTNDVDDRLVIADDGNVGIGTDDPSALLEVSGSAPTFILNANSQATNKKKIRLAASQFTAGDFNIQQMNDDGTTIALTAMTIINGGNVGIRGATTPAYEFDHTSDFSAGQTKVLRRRYDEVVVAYNQGTGGAGTSTVTVTLSVVGLRGVVLTADFSGSRNNSGPDNYMTRICHALMSESTNLRRSDRLTGLEFAVGSTPVTVSSVAMSSDNIVVTYSVAPNSNAYDARMLFTAKGPGIQDVDVSVSFA